MGPNMDKVRINEFGLHGTTMVTHNKNTKSDTFITLSRCNEIAEEDDIVTSYAGINMFDRQYGRIIDNPSDSDNLENTNNNSTKEFSNTDQIDIDNILTMSIISGALLSGVFAYHFLRRY